MEVVDLLQACGGELLDERGHVDAVTDQSHPTQPSADLPERPQIDVHDPVDAGALDLHDHVAQTGVVRQRIGEDGTMRLPERRRRERPLVDRCEGPRQRHPELFLGARPHLGERHRGDFVLQPLELFRDDGRQDVEARRHELSDLDHQTAEIDRQRVEAPRDDLEPARPAPGGDPLEAEPRQEQLVPPRLDEVARGEPRDAPVAGAHEGVVGHRISGMPMPPRTVGLGHPQLWARME